MSLAARNAAAFTYFDAFDSMRRACYMLARRFDPGAPHDEVAANIEARKILLEAMRLMLDDARTIYERRIV